MSKRYSWEVEEFNAIIRKAEREEVIRNARKVLNDGGPADIRAMLGDMIDVLNSNDM